MVVEFRYSLDIYPLLYAMFGLAAASWLLAIVGLAAQLARARPVARLDRPGARIAAALRDATAQRPIWRRPLAGAMHLALTAGAALLLAAFIVTHFQAPRGPEWTRGHLIRALYDAAILLMLLGLGIAAWRRHLRRELPARAEDVGLWALLLLLALSALLSEALLIALARPAWRGSAFLSAPLAHWLGACSLPLRRGLYGVSWSLLHVAVLGMAILAPWTKWRHAVLAPLALFSRKMGPPSRLDPLDLETDGPYGALRPRDLTWKERLDLAACTHCGRCTQACPAAVAGAELDPHRTIDAMDASSSLRIGAIGPLADALATACGGAAIWQCTTCMACDDVCPVGISPLSLVVDLRRERVLDAAHFPEPLRGLFDNLARRGNPWGLPRSERDAWLASSVVPSGARDLDSRAESAHRGEPQRSALPVLAPGEQTDVLLWLGCMGGYDPRAREAALALAGVLTGSGIRVAVLGPDEGCCGDPARRAGNEALWRDLARENLAALAARRCDRIVTLCPHCANTLANEYADLGAHLPVTHAAPYLSELVGEGRLSLCAAEGGPSAGDSPVRVAFHDPCYLARGLGETDAPRTLLAALPGVQLVELPRHGRDTLCCGAGGARMWLEGPGEPRLGRPRLDELVAAGGDLWVTACPYCRTMIADAAAETNGALPAICDVVELCAGVLCPNPSPTPVSARDQE